MQHWLNGLHFSVLREVGGNSVLFVFFLELTKLMLNIATTNRVIETFANLDPNNRLEDLRKKKKSMLYPNHSRSVINSLTEVTYSG